MRKLVVADLVVSQRGHGGGFMLARSARDIRFDEILSAVDIGVYSDACVFGWPKCSEQNSCPMHPAWSKLKTRFQTWCATSTLADVDVAGFDRLVRIRKKR
jgi:Rrf2 family transcriptional regulator, iron-sulfur cluster assembly transcription factor